MAIAIVPKFSTPRGESGFGRILFLGVASDFLGNFFYAILRFYGTKNAMFHGRRRGNFLLFYAFLPLKMHFSTGAAGENFYNLRFFTLSPQGRFFIFLPNLWQQKLGNPKSKNFI